MMRAVGGCIVCILIQASRRGIGWFGDYAQMARLRRNIASSSLSPLMIGISPFWIKIAISCDLRAMGSTGVSDVASKEYASNDVENSPTSAFEPDQTTQQWLRFISANIGENLRTCPAPGHKHNPLQNSSKQILQASPISTPPRSLLQYLLEHLLAILPTQSAKRTISRIHFLQQSFMQFPQPCLLILALMSGWRDCGISILVRILLGQVVGCVGSAFCKLIKQSPSS